MVYSPVKISVNSSLFYALFSTLVCIISLPVCHNMGDYNRFCLPSLLLPLNLLQVCLFFLLRLFHTPSAFHLLCFHHGSQQKGPLVLFSLLHLTILHPSENGIIDMKPSIISKFRSVCGAMRKKVFL